LVPESEVAEDGTITDEALADVNRAEVKNISSHKGAEQALAYEVTRQENVLRRGREIEQETRHWDEARGVTVSMRSKEAEKDYRYFREADLPALEVSDWKSQIPIPELPDARRERFREEYGLDRESASKLTSTKAVADFFEDVAEQFDPELAATWVADNLLGELNYREMEITDVEDRLDEFKRLIELVAADELTVKNAEEIVLREMLDAGEDPETVIEREGLGVADSGEVEAAVTSAIDDNPDAVDDYHDGDEGAINFLVGQVMQATGGSADPGEVNERAAPRGAGRVGRRCMSPSRSSARGRRSTTSRTTPPTQTSSARPATTRRSRLVDGRRFRFPAIASSTPSRFSCSGLKRAGRRATNRRTAERRRRRVSGERSADDLSEDIAIETASPDDRLDILRVLDAAMLETDTEVVDTAIDASEALVARFKRTNAVVGGAGRNAA